jgi:hypothetical protein
VEEGGEGDMEEGGAGSSITPKVQEVYTEIGACLLACLCICLSVCLCCYFVVVVVVVVVGGGGGGGVEGGRGKGRRASIDRSIE